MKVRYGGAAAVLSYQACFDERRHCAHGESNYIWPL